MAGDGRYDVAIAGASVAGCAAARLYGLAGARVALIEKRPDIDAYKTVCTHFIQRSATATLERLGLSEALEQAGANHNTIDVWTTLGLVRAPDGGEHGYNIRRRVLDPLLRHAAAETPGVDFLPGRTVTGLLGDGRPAGLVTRDRHGEEAEMPASLVVGADGRGSLIARLAGVPGRVRPHGRFFYWAYYRGLDWPHHPRSRMWILGRDAAYVFPNEDGLTLVLAAPHQDRKPGFKADPEGSFAAFIDSLPGGPSLATGTREGKLIGKLDVPNVSRPAARPGVAFIGDAALASDPLWGIGCGWALQSAEWLVDETAGALADPGALDAALEHYRRRHARSLGPHHFLIADLASGRELNPFERFLFRAGARDPQVAEVVEAVGSRSVSPAAFLHPRTLARAARANLREPAEV